MDEIGLQNALRQMRQPQQKADPLAERLQLAKDYGQMGMNPKLAFQSNHSPSFSQMGGFLMALNNAARGGTASNPIPQYRGAMNVMNHQMQNQQPINVSVPRQFAQYQPAMGSIFSLRGR